MLTADHVADQLEDCDRVGMLVDIRRGLRRCAFERAHLTWLRIGTAPYGCEGPDIAVNARWFGHNSGDLTPDTGVR